MPYTSIPVYAPLGLPTNIPSQQRIRIASLSRDPSGLQLREMGLEKADLMLSVYAWGVGGRLHDAKVVPNLPRVDFCRSLGNQFSSPHRLPIPVC